MKKAFLFALIGGLALACSGQGYLDWGNNFSGTFRAPIYTSLPGHIYEFVSGQSSLGNPVGNTVYTGPLLSGTGWTFGVFVGPESAADSSALTLLVTTTFRTTTATGLQALPKGLVFGGTTSVPGVWPGYRCKYQIRVWDNCGGTATSWEAAVFGYSFSRWYSTVVTSGPLGGIGTDGTPILNPQTIGWTSFNVPIVPEPGSLGLALLGAAGFFLLRHFHSR